MSSTADDDVQTFAVNVEGIGSDSRLSKADTSTQLPERRIRSMSVGIKPPYNPDRLAAFIELNETLAVGIRKKSRYEVGYGFELPPIPDIDRDDADDEEFERAKAFWRGADSRWQTKARQSAEPATPEEVLELARQDYHLIGWCCLEILVNLEGDPVGLAHVPANTVRVRQPQPQYDQPRHPEEGRFVDGDVSEYASRGYVQVRNGRRRYFGEAGDRYRGRGEDDTRDPIFVDKETGDVALESAENLDNAPANELIFITNPSPLADDYGVPDWVSAIRTISADEAAKDYNREFFDNDTIPRLVIKVTGGELTEQSRQDLKQMLHGLREESHRAVTLEVEKFQSQLDGDVEIELEPLGQGISEEMDFRLFREKNEHEIAKVLEMPPKKIGNTETANRSNSESQDREFAIEVIEPEQHKFSERLYRTLHQQALDVQDWTIEFELRGADQPEREAQMTERRVRSMRLAGVATVNQTLEELGLPTRDDELGGMTLQEFEAEFAGGNSGGETEASGAVDAALPPPEHKIGERDWSVVESALAEKEIEQMQFNSSNLDEGLYDFDEQELYLSFLREDGQSSLYAYVNVPPTEWTALTNAGSHGGYHYDSIRMEYPYLEITNFHDRLPEGPTPDSEDVPDDIPDI